MLKIVETVKPLKKRRVVFSQRIDYDTHLEYIYLSLLLKKHGRKIPAGDVLTSIVQNINSEMRHYLKDYEGEMLSMSQEFMEKYIELNK
jgi:hypothetical protein